MVKVAILDSGIEQNHKNFGNVKFSQTYKTDSSFSSNLIIDHGTAVADVLRKSIIKNGDIGQVEFFDIRVFDDLENISDDNITKGIVYCIENEIDIINISIGLPSDSPTRTLYKVCYEAYQKNIIIVAAAYYKDISCFPACFPFVFGVTGGIISSFNEFGIQEHDNIELIGKGTLQRVATLNNNSRFVAGTSFATPHITGIIASLKQKNSSLQFDDIKNYLFLNGKKNISLISGFKQRRDETDISFNFNKNHTYWKKISKYFNWEEKFGWIKKISFYPLSIKEFSAIEYFSEMCPFNIVDLIDLPSSITKSSEITIKNKIIKKKWKKEHLSTDIDTLVLGYPNELAIEMNLKFYNDLLEFYAKQDISIFALDNGGLEEYKKAHSKFYDHEPRYYLPTILKQDIPNFTYLKNTGKIKTPVLSVAGISAQSGKFTTQLKIKKLLNNAGYKVGWLSTEPQGELFGADISFPYGLKSNINFGIETWPQLLSSIIKGIELFKEPDIIISGHQSGLIPFSKNLSLDSNAENFRSLFFIGGICPDAIILNVSINDEIELIEKNIKVLKNLYGIDVLFIVLSSRYRELITVGDQTPIVKKNIANAKLWIEKADFLNKGVGIPIVNIFDESNDDLILNIIIDYFSK